MDSLKSTSNVYLAPKTLLQVSDAQDGAIAKSGICNIEVVGSEETLGHTIYKVSHWILFNYSMGGNPHAKTMVLFDMLGHYKWDAKAVLVLSAFATSYGEFWLIMQLYPCNPLATSIALLKQLPKDLCLLKHLFKVLNVLMKTIVDLTKCIIEFEELPVNHVILDCEAIGTTNSQIYMATYWIIRSALICSSQIKDLRAMKNVQVHVPSLQSGHHILNSVVYFYLTIASWELSSLVGRLSTISSHLRRQVDACYKLIETKMHNKLLDLSKESHIDNQEVLEMLFALKDSLPLKDSSSQAKLALSELKSKVVILLVSRPELLPIEVLLLLVQQMFDHPHRVNLQGSYEIVWVPIPSSDTWTDVEEQNFDFLSNSLPWFSIRRPWLLSSIVVKSIKQACDFKEKPLMVVLDTQGMVTNLNAIDMALIWGAMAFPFSTSRENELWEEETWNLQLLLDGIDPLVAKWESHIDNQEVLEMLFALKDSLPLKDSSSQAKLALSELKSKVVILLVSRPELLPIEVLLLLVQQMFDHPHRVNLQGSYEIVWVPIPSSDTWTDVEEQNFDFLSNSLPWFSIRRPWLLSSIVVKSIKQAWDFKEKPLMVVLDTQGMVTNLNAIDMALIWGAMAFPFSTSRENELWEEETWNLQLLLDGIDPLVAKWVEEDQNICIYGSNNIDWIREFNAKMRNMTSAGLQLKMVYVGKKNSSDDHMKNILATMYEEKLTSSLTCTKIYFFWLRLESMRRSKLRLGHTDDHKDEILKQLSELLDTNDESEKGWVLLGKESSTETLKLQGRKIMECMDLFPVWGENVAMLGLVGAITTAIEPPLLVEPCSHSNIIQFVEGLKDTTICDKCKRLLEKFVVYKCDGTE
ncbi:hypothetical protein TEA_016261 [Camellia sinensis var. sinensis]|uniref:Sieve element occlusion N-terminal domain-containing protein n=1 Tax=Camellia sinensis var. sinensis TaxID=542762 RepID=A0A4S4EWA8_CAMSN|nr:hypothetical protein TEA_016261 [Camellia sinensis var. sinensis]